VSYEPGLGAVWLGQGRCRFRVWAPRAARVEVRIVSPQPRLVPLARGERGYHEAVIEDLEPGSLYLYRLDGRLERPDPASRFQPRGVAGPSQVVDPAFDWQEGAWASRPLRDYVIYELHLGTFSQAGTCRAAIEHLDDLVELGVSAVELMPVAQFPGRRNWGYDGVYPFAVQDSYGGPAGLKGLVEACHRRGLAVILDVVYNHLGPEGNYFQDFGPYFSDRCRTPWGRSLNFDGPDSDEVRRFFIENALYWLGEFHLDALRLDAVHAIFDFSAQPFLEELAIVVDNWAISRGRPAYLIAENALNDARLVRPREEGGLGLPAQWNDDFHHALHGLLTCERNGYYADFGRLEHLARAFEQGYVYTGQYSTFRRRRQGSSPGRIRADQLIVFSQNHDQVGNRSQGERLSGLVSFERLKLAAALVLLSPFVPLLFMGEEYGETAPFRYFISHSDPDLIEAVRQGRRAELAAFDWPGQPPDPQDEGVFLSAKLDRSRRQGRGQVLREFYRELIQLRRNRPALANLSKEDQEVTVFEKEGFLLVRRWADNDEIAALFHFGREAGRIELPLPQGRWRKLLDSSEERWLGPGSQAGDTVESSGALALTRPGPGVALWTREKEIPE